MVGHDEAPLPLLTIMGTGKIGIYGFDDDSHGTIRNLTDGIKSVYTAQTMI
jgi:hypothetical protein